MPFGRVKSKPVRKRVYPRRLPDCDAARMFWMDGTDCRELAVVRPFLTEVLEKGRCTAIGSNDLLVPTYPVWWR